MGGNGLGEGVRRVEFFCYYLGKLITIKMVKFFFTFNDNTKTKILLSQLSSGEKQMLILLYTTIIQNNKECITFWDEPEVSLHIEWQRKLIRVIWQLNPNMQLIIATHSPSILFEGWEKRALNIEELLEQ